jgi:hypothetical protein
MQCEESRGQDSSAMMIRVHVRVSYGMHVHTASSDVQVFAVGESRAHEVVFNSLMQPDAAWGGLCSVGHAHPKSI